MNVNFRGFNENTATFVVDGKLENTGVPVKISGDGTVKECASGDKFCGICVAVRDGYASVQLSGYAEVKTSEKLAPGFAKLAAGTNGAVSANDNGREYLVINSTANEAGIIL